MIDVLIFFIISLTISVIFVILARIRGGYKKDDNLYECGFDPQTEKTKPFHIHFYQVAILFIVFDVEMIFLIPWALSLNIIGTGGFVSMAIFIIIILIGVIYEIKNSVLKWPKS